MNRKLFSVEESAYTVSGKLVLASKSNNDFLNIKIGDFIILVTPNGTEIETEITGAENFKNHNTLINTIFVENLTKEQVPIGTEIYLTVSKRKSE